MPRFATRLTKMHKSFVREILKATQNREIISLAGGLPNPNFFPVQEIAEATAKVLEADGKTALQYSITEGYLPLRQFIAQRYQTQFGLEVTPEEVLITNGSQQGLDLVGKIFLDRGDPLLIERPGYPGAIHSFSVYEPDFRGVPLLEDGPDIAALQAALEVEPAKLFYGVPNFQNPSGITYSAQKRAELAACLKTSDTVYVEDNPYGELRFEGEFLPPLRHYLGEQAILLGSFSKIVSPGMRLGWICASREIMERLITVKQASDLHSNFFSQRVVHQFLQDNDLERHLARIRAAYKQQRDLMIEMIEECFPPEITYVKPEGGMFLWLQLPDEVPARSLLEEAIQQGVVFVPGDAFYPNGNGGQHQLRLSFSNAEAAKIEKGMRGLAEAAKTVLTQQRSIG
jgi:2-aminoadipate transaminase